MKFQRVYTMTVQTDDLGSTVSFSNPLTLELEIERNVLASANRGFFRIYNLKEDTRRRIFLDRYQTATYRRVTLCAGYRSDPRLPVIFQGNVMKAGSVRRRQDWVTEIEALDGAFGMINGQAGTTLPAGTDTRAILRNLIRSMPNITLGAIGDVGDKKSDRSVVLSGNAWDILERTVPDASAFVDNEAANVISKSQYIPEADDPLLISAETGLLETPRRYDALLDLRMMFEPQLKLGRLVKVESRETYYNGQYVAVGVRHAGVISDAVGGELTTTATVNAVARLRAA